MTKRRPHKIGGGNAGEAKLLRKLGALMTDLTTHLSLLPCHVLLKALLNSSSLDFCQVMAYFKVNFGISEAQET